MFQFEIRLRIFNSNRFQNWIKRERESSRNNLLKVCVPRYAAHSNDVLMSWLNSVCAAFERKKIPLANKFNCAALTTFIMYSRKKPKLIAEKRVFIVCLGMYKYLIQFILHLKRFLLLLLLNCFFLSCYCGKRKIKLIRQKREVYISWPLNKILKFCEQYSNK